VGVQNDTYNRYVFNDLGFEADNLSAKNIEDSFLMRSYQWVWPCSHLRP